MVDGFIIEFLKDPIITNIGLAILALVIGMLLGRASKKLIFAAGKKLDVKNRRAIRSFAMLFEWFIFIIAIIAALSFLGVDAAGIVIKNMVGILPPLISLVLLLFLGVIFINLIIDLFLGLLYRVGLNEYLAAVGIHKGVVNNLFLGLKFFLYLILLSSSLNYVGLAIPSIDVIVTALIYMAVLLGGAFTFFIFKEPLTNFFAGLFIEKYLLKIGQRVTIGEHTGEVLAITNHATLLRLPTGFNVFIPNKQLLTELIFLKRARTDISKLEEIRKNYVAQLPSFCGPASAAMMLSFFGFEATQEVMGKLCGTKTPGGTTPEGLIAGVRKFTGNVVNGVLIRFEEIYNLRDEVKSWLSEGALILLWFKKPVVFPEKRSKSGHYVLCVGIEGDELVVMDPSQQTGGVYLVDYRLISEAMSKELGKKSRGYFVFAKKGTSAYWRIAHGLIYSDISAYKELSASFEKYLRRIIRRTATIQDVLSPPVSDSLAKERVRHVWEPKKTEEIKEEITKQQEKAKPKEKKKKK